MKRFVSIISLSLALILAFGPVQSARAEEAGAKVVQVKGDAVTVSQDGTRQPINLGQQLASGDRIVTKGGGGVTLLLDDGSQLAIGANTDMTLTELSKEKENHTTLFSVFEGLIKATVKKLTVGSRFELSSNHGVAAVKGTEYEATVKRDKGMEIRVKEGRVWLHDLKRERKVVIDEKRKAMVKRSRLSKVKDMQKRELKRFENWSKVDRDAVIAAVRDKYGDEAAGRVEQRLNAMEWRHTSMPRDLDKERKFRKFWHSLKPGQKRRFVSAAKESLGETWDDIHSLREEERQAKWQRRLRRVDDMKLANEESRVDFTLGNVLIDRHGKRVRMEEFLLRPNARTLQFLNYTKREGRTDIVNSSHIYNKDLPRRLGDPGLRLGKKEWKHVAPEYWVTRGVVIFGNDKGDSLAMSEGFFDPVQVEFLGQPVAHWVLPVSDFELRINVPDLRFPEGGVFNPNDGVLLEKYVRWSRGVHGGGANSDGWDFTNAAVTALVPGGVNPLSGGFNVAANSDLSLKGGLALTSGGVTHFDVGPKALDGKPGDLSGGFVRRYGDGTVLVLASHVIDEHGEVRNAFNLLEGTNGNLFEAMIQLAFFSFNEIEIYSNAFQGPGIDVVSKMLWWSHISKNKDDL